MPFSLHNLSRLIAYSHHQAVQPLGATAVIARKFSLYFFITKTFRQQNFALFHQLFDLIISGYVLYSG